MYLVRHTTSIICLLLSFSIYAQPPRILTNQVGYEISLSKHAVLIAATRLDITAFQLIDTRTGQLAYQDPVSKLKNWIFWTLDFGS